MDPDDEQQIRKQATAEARIEILIPILEKLGRETGQAEVMRDWSAYVAIASGFVLAMQFLTGISTNQGIVAIATLAGAAGYFHFRQSLGSKLETMKDQSRELELEYQIAGRAGAPSLPIQEQHRREREARGE